MYFIARKLNRFQRHDESDSGILKDLKGIDWMSDGELISERNEVRVGRVGRWIPQINIPFFARLFSSGDILESYE